LYTAKIANAGRFRGVDGLICGEAQKKMAGVCGAGADLATATVTYPAEGLGREPAAVLGHADSDGVLRPEHGLVPLPESALPVLLPEQIEITQQGGSPLGGCRSFVNTTCPVCGGPARRETDTMDTFVDSSWYFYRYTDAKNSMRRLRRRKAKYWFPIDQYIGGVEHAILHLIYSRFWTKVMRDLGLIE
jgi:leucyl-tRNA synthetase